MLRIKILSIFLIKFCHSYVANLKYLFNFLNYFTNLKIGIRLNYSKSPYIIRGEGLGGVREGLRG